MGLFGADREREGLIEPFFVEEIKQATLYFLKRRQASLFITNDTDAQSTRVLYKLNKDKCKQYKCEAIFN